MKERRGREHLLAENIDGRLSFFQQAMTKFEISPVYSKNGEERIVASSLSRPLPLPFLLLLSGPSPLFYFKSRAAGFFFIFHSYFL